MENLNPLFEISKIIAKQKLDELSEKENKILINWLNESENNKKVYHDLLNNQILVDEITNLNKYKTKEAYKKLQIIINSDKSRQLRIFPAAMFKYAAAIALLIISSVFAYFYFNKISENIEVVNINPGTQKAILITSNNQRIELGKTEKKSIFKFSKATVTDTSSTLAYEAYNEPEIREETVEYNQLEIPRGGEYKLILSDGTKVILNSETSLKFPVVFNGEAREVELTGEAYFEVTKSKNPFLVKVNGMKVKVYGTKFNVCGYKTEKYIETTLIEGKVGIEVNKESKVIEYSLEPGIQASYNKTDAEVEMKEVNTDQYIAWTKGLFVFENEKLENILTKLGRWYNVDFAFQNESLKNERFTGDLKRYDDIRRILDMISIASNIEFKIGGDNIMVRENNK